jgi:AcrR family transcriptional regulator
MSKGELTRQRIIEQTAPLFNQRGFRTLPLSDIMEATGLQKGGIYNHFTSKEELALAAFDYAVQRLGNRFARSQPGQTPLETLREGIERFRESREKPVLAGGCPLLNSAIESDDAFPALRDKVSKVISAFHRQIANLVLEAQKAGELKPDVDPSVVATIIFTCLEGGIFLGRLHEDGNHMGRCCDHLLNFLETLRAI